MTSFGDLPRLLWSGPLKNPRAPGQALLAAVRQGRYIDSLNGLRRLSAWRLPFEGALEAALARWDWSIDLALVTLEAADDPGQRLRALDLIEARVLAQNRRRASLARAAWRLDRPARARAALRVIDPASPTATEDRACRIELALLASDWAAAEADLAALADHADVQARLALRCTYLRHGGAALADRLEQADTTTLALPGFWRLGFDLLLSERDFGAARRLLARARGLPASPAELSDATLRLALEAEDAEEARALFEPEIADLPPWTWSPRQHAMWLRLTLTQARAQDDPALLHRCARDHAERAARLHGRHAGLRDQLLGCRLLTDDWDTIATELLALPPDPERVWTVARVLNRIGLHDDARACLQRSLDAMGDGGPAATPGARRLLALAETALLAGDPDGAELAITAAQALAPSAPTAADLSLMRAETQLWQGLPTDSAATLAPLTQSHGQRPGLWLTRARADYFRADFAASDEALARFHALKQAQLGKPAPEDLRDMIVADARAAARLAALAPGARPPAPAATAAAQARAIAASPGLAALSLYPVAPAFRPVEGAAIPRRIAHYWEGPRSHAVERGLRVWAARHPEFAQIVHGPAEARGFLCDHHPDLVPLFDRQAVPATRADLFRMALMFTHGGLYADVDEYPRAPVTPWLEGARAVMALESGYGTVANNFLAAVPGLALFARMIEQVRDRLATVEKPYAWWDCGPAPLTRCVYEALRDPAEAAGLRLLRQHEYCARVSTNLPFPHKQGALHWR